MKLIIDSGSTKMHLCLLARDGSCRQWERPGVNALTASADELKAIFNEERWPELSEIFFYGAGMIGKEVREKVKSALPPARFKVEVESDLLGAARALFPGHEYGVAVILGTGSNSCYYDGFNIERNIPPLGFIMGDEGSGANIGIRFLRLLYRGAYDPEVRSVFEQETGLSYSDVLDHVYRQPHPNRFVASLTPFISKHMNEFPLLRKTVRDSFWDLYWNVLCHYGQKRLAFVGGIAAAFKEEVIYVFDRECSVFDVQARPMDGLIKFHS